MNTKLWITVEDDVIVDGKITPNHTTSTLSIEVTTDGTPDSTRHHDEVLKLLRKYAKKLNADVT